jgi:hypothetical protein
MAQLEARSIDEVVEWAAYQDQCGRGINHCGDNPARNQSPPSIRLTRSIQHWRLYRFRRKTKLARAIRCCVKRRVFNRSEGILIYYRMGAKFLKPCECSLSASLFSNLHPFEFVVCAMISLIRYPHCIYLGCESVCKSADLQVYQTKQPVSSIYFTNQNRWRCA